MANKLFRSGGWPGSKGKQKATKNPRQEKQQKKNKCHHRNFSAFFGAVFLGLPNRQVTISGDSFTIQCHHPPADEDSKLVRHVRWEPSISNINLKKNECQTCVSIEAFGGEKAPERVIRKNFQHEKWDRKPKIVRSHETLSKWMCMFQKQIAWISGSMDQVDSGLWAWSLRGDFPLGIVLHYIFLTLPV